MTITMPPAGVSEIHGVGVVKIEDPFATTQSCVGSRDGLAICPLCPIRHLCPTSSVGHIGAIPRCVLIVAVTPCSYHILVRQVRLSATADLVGVCCTLVGFLNRRKIYLFLIVHSLTGYLFR